MARVGMHRSVAIGILVALLLPFLAPEADVVYRGGTRTLDALTPAAKDLEWEPGKFAPGLFTFRDAAQAFGNSPKAQIIDPNWLPANLQAIQGQPRCGRPCRARPRPGETRKRLSASAEAGATKKVRRASFN
jgi:hypothetical protein